MTVWRQVSALFSPTISNGLVRDSPQGTDANRISIVRVLSIATIAVAIIGVGRGAIPISPVEVLQIVCRRLGWTFGPGITAQKDAVLWSIRLPRVVLSLLVGAALGLSGAALQGVFRNPLADPGLIGVSSGAALGAVGAIVSGFAPFGLWTLPIAAFIGALTVSLFVFRVAYRNGRVEVVTLVLCGVAVNALAGAGIGLLTSIASDNELRDISFWQLGSVGGATWPFVIACAPFVTFAVVALPQRARQLDLLVLGEREARHLGVPVERLRLLVIAICALATGSAVAVAGILGFVGLIVPHLIRLVAGPSHRTLLPASALGGAIVTTLADLVARTVAVPREVPLGVMTALIGAPLFLWLIRRSRQQFGGFA
jgi:iron complex transport system permease protein